METDGVKLEWMYKNSKDAVDPEEYLLGKPIDKDFESQQSGFNEIDKDILPTSIFANASSNVQVDVVRKLKEDPLEQIKQKEIEARRQLLKNPVKLKKLQNMLKIKAEESSKKEKKHKKKKKKKSDIDQLIAEKYLKLMKKFGVKNVTELNKVLEEAHEEKPKKKKKKKSKCNSDSDIQNDVRNENLKEVTIENKPTSEDTVVKVVRNYRKRAVSSSEDETPQKKAKSSGKEKHNKNSKHSGHSRNRNQNSYRNRPTNGRFLDQEDYRRSKSERHSEDLHRRDKIHEKDYRKEKYSKVRSSNIEKSSKDRVAKVDDCSSEEENVKHKKYGLVLPKGKDVKKKEDRKVEHSPKKSEMKVQPRQKYKSSKLSEEEKEKRLKEMIDNAKWRDKERKKNIERYREEEKKEKLKEKHYDGDFLRKQMNLATSTASIEQRIKSSINHIQKSGMSMERNFAKR